jgi:hypothetical protein
MGGGLGAVGGGAMSALTGGVTNLLGAGASYIPGAEKVAGGIGAAYGGAKGIFSDISSGISSRNQRLLDAFRAGQGGPTSESSYADVMAHLRR